MAVVERKSGVCTNRDATPRVMVNPGPYGGIMKSAAGTLETVNGDSIASVYRMFSIPSNARVHQVLLFSDDIGTTTVADFGLYRTTADGGAVVDADFFASAVVLNAGALNAVDITHEAGTGGYGDINVVEKMIWEALGLAADPSYQYDLCATLTAAADAAATLSVKAVWVQ